MQKQDSSRDCGSRGQVPVRKGASCSCMTTWTSGYALTMAGREPTWSMCPCVTAKVRQDSDVALALVAHHAYRAWRIALRRLLTYDQLQLATPGDVPDAREHRLLILVSRHPSVHQDIAISCFKDPGIDIHFQEPA